MNKNHYFCSLFYLYNMDFRKIVILCCSALLGYSAMSGENVLPDDEKDVVRSIVDSIRVRSNGNVQIYQSAKLNEMLVRDTTGTNVETPEIGVGTTVVHRTGYRIQVYSDNRQRLAKQRAEQIAGEISGIYPLIGTYMAYKAPYWRLRVGNYLTREEAEIALEDLKTKFPSLAGEMVIVRDRIIIIE